MIIKKNCTFLVFFSLIIPLMLCINTHLTVNNAIESNVIKSSSITPYSHDIRWRYKMINGILYKRQYNYTTNKWIGSWVKA